MGRSLIQRILVMLLLAALLAPVLEAFDRWDSTPGLSVDTEFRVAALAVAAGLIAAVAFVAVRVASPFAPLRRFQQCAARIVRRTTNALPFYSGSSPPSIPLRI